MFLLNLTCLAAYATLGVTPSTAIRANPIVTTDSAPLLTVDALARMTTFWAAFMQEPPAVRDTARFATQEQDTLSLDLGSTGQRPTQVKMVNMVAMAAKYPSVAADFKKAGLTPQQWEDFRKALFAANYVGSSGPGSGNSGYTATAAKKHCTLQSSVVGKNVAFLHAHQKEFDALKATQMFIPKVQMQQGGQGDNDSGDDLNP